MEYTKRGKIFDENDQTLYLRNTSNPKTPVFFHFLNYLQIFARVQQKSHLGKLTGQKERKKGDLQGMVNIHCSLVQKSKSWSLLSTLERVCLGTPNFFLVALTKHKDAINQQLPETCSFHTLFCSSRRLIFADNSYRCTNDTVLSYMYNT